MNHFLEINSADVDVEHFDNLVEASEFAEEQVAMGACVMINQTSHGYFVSVYEPRD